MASAELTIQRNHIEDYFKKFRALPSIIAGRPDQEGLHNIFRSAFVHKLLSLIHSAFITKSLSEADDLGHEFAPLSAKRLKQKSSPKFLARFPNSIPHAIMRVTDTMLNSYMAGLLSGDQYFPPKNQAVELRGNLIKIFSRVDYAEYQAARRPFWPDDISPWINQAITAGIEALIERMKTL